MKRIAILHYAAPPTIGGVEATMAYHARGLMQLGYQVRILSGSGAPLAENQNIESFIDPLLGSMHPEVIRAKADLDRGHVPVAFADLRSRLIAILEHALQDCDVCLAHNIPTFNKNLALTAALADIQRRKITRVIAWCHDLAWTNPQYLPELHQGQPWDLMRQVWEGVRYVTVSESRREELCQLLGLPPEQITVVPPGVDLGVFFRWTPAMEALVTKLRLGDADGILLLPARITRRKNIELALRVLEALRTQSGRDFRLIVSGPPGPHNPANPGYLGELLDLRRTLHLEQSAHFLYALGETDQPFIPDDQTMGALYQFSDALLFPSLQEGFGIPMLEAGLAGIPIFSADLPPMRATGGAEAYYFDPQSGAPQEIASVIRAQLDSSPAYRLRLRVRQHYRWDAIIRDQIIPLVEEP